MARNQVDIILRAVDQASGVIDRINRQVTKLEQNPSWQKISRDSALVAGGLAAAGTAAAGLGTAAVLMAGRLEQAEIAFTTMLGSAEKAGRFLDDLADFAASTPFRFEGLQQSSRLLLAFGFQAEAIVPIMTTLGDATAALGGNAETLDGVVRAIGQIQTKGKVSAEELMQLAERGIPVFEILREKLNLTAEEVGNIGNAGVSSTEAINAILEGLGERFAGSMAAQSQTLLGLFSTVQDNVSLTMTRIGEDIIEALNLKDAARNLITQLDALRSRVEDVGLAGIFEGIREHALTAAGAIAGMLLPAVINLTIATTRFLARIAPWAIAGALVVQVMDELGVTIEPLIRENGYLHRLAAMTSGLVDVFSGVTKAIAFLVENTIKSITDWADFLAAFFDGLNQTAGAAMAALQAGTPGAVGPIWQSFADATADYWTETFDGLVEGSEERIMEANRLVTAGWDKVKAAFSGELDPAAMASVTTIVDGVTEIANQVTTYALPGVDDLTEGFVSMGDAAEESAARTVEALGRVSDALGFLRDPNLGDPAGAFTGSYLADQAAIAVPKVEPFIPEQIEREGWTLDLAEAPLKTITAIDDRVPTWGERLGNAVDNALMSGDFLARAARIAVPVPAPVEPGLPGITPDRYQPLEDIAPLLDDVVVLSEYLVNLNAATTPLTASLAEVRNALVHAQAAELLRAEQIREVNQLLARQSPVNIARSAQQQGAWAGAGRGTPGGPSWNERLVADASPTLGNQIGGRPVERGGRGDFARSGGLDEAEEIIAQSVTNVGTALENLASTHLPLFSSALQGLAQGGPIGALIAVFGDLLSRSEAFQKLMEFVNEVLAMIADTLGLLLEAVMPIIEPLLELTKVLLPLIEIAAKVLTPVFRVLGTVLGFLADIILGIANAFIAVYNFLLGWLFGYVDYLKREQSGRSEADREAERRAGGGGARIAEITGQTRDLLVDLLTPLALIPTQLVVMQQIRDILDSRLTPALTTEAAGTAPASIGTVNITIEGSDNPRATADAVYERLTRQLRTEMRVSAI